MKTPIRPSDLFKTALEKLAVITSLRKHIDNLPADSEERKQILKLTEKFFSKEENVEFSYEEYLTMLKIYHEWLDRK
jgi:hypothetical protein